jgi:hypothetical protein
MIYVVVKNCVNQDFCHYNKMPDLNNFIKRKGLFWCMVKEVSDKLLLLSLWQDSISWLECMAAQKQRKERCRGQVLYFL